MNDILLLAMDRAIWTWSLARLARRVRAGKKLTEAYLNAVSVRKK